MARVDTNYYYSYSKGLDTSTGARNVSPNQSLVQAYKDSQDAAAYRKLKQQANIVDSTGYNPALVPENHDFYKREYWDDATRQDQRVINNAADAQTRRQTVKVGDASSNWYAKQWDDEITSRRNSGISGGSAGDEIYYAQVTESMRKSPFGGNRIDRTWATDAYDRRMKDKHYDTDAQMRNNQADRSHQLHVMSAEKQQAERNNLWQQNENAADRALKERLALIEANAAIQNTKTSNIFNAVGNFNHNYQYWG